MSNNKQMSVIDMLKQDLDIEIKAGVKMIVNWDGYKAMHKKELIDFADNYVDNCVIPNENMAIPTIMDVPQYYNETFGDNNE